MYGGRHQDWQRGLGTILHRLGDTANGCQLVAELPLDDVFNTNLAAASSCKMMKNAYNSIPLAGVEGSVRGLCIQEVARRVDIMCNPAASYSTGRSGRHRISHDWIRDGVCVECKSVQLAWSPSDVVWRVIFQHIKFKVNGMNNDSVTDEFHLVLYTPSGLYISICMISS
jgi:hypothetical protein